MQDWKHVGPVTLVTKRCGVTKRYPFRSLKALVTSISYELLGAITDKNEYYYKPSDTIVVGCRVLNNHPPHMGWLGVIFVEDECGLVVPRWKVDEAVKTYRKAPRHPRWVLQYYGDFEFRRSPVPRTGKSRWSFHNFYKTPRTLQELKNSYLDEDEIYYGVKVRPKRNRHHLKTAWNDYPRSDIRERKNWKNWRKKQWKGS